MAECSLYNPKSTNAKTYQWYVLTIISSTIDDDLFHIRAVYGIIMVVCHYQSPICWQQKPIMIIYNRAMPKKHLGGLTSQIITGSQPLFRIHIHITWRKPGDPTMTPTWRHHDPTMHHAGPPYASWGHRIARCRFGSPRTPAWTATCSAARDVVLWCRGNGPRCRHGDGDTADEQLLTRVDYQLIRVNSG